MNAHFLESEGRRYVSALKATAVALSVVALSQAVHAADEEGFETDFAGGIEVASRELRDDGNSPPPVRELVLPGVIKQEVDAAWADGSPASCDTIRQRVAEVTSGGGFSARDVQCQLAASGELRARVREAAVDLKYIARNNVVTFWVTTPDVCFDVPLFGRQCIGASRHLDPKFTITFDAELRMSVPVNRIPQRLEARPEPARVFNARLDSANLTGDLVSMGDDVVQLFGGPGYFQAAEGAVNAMRPRVGGNVARSLRRLDPVIDRFRADRFVPWRMRPLLGPGRVVIEFSRKSPITPLDPEPVLLRPNFAGKWHTAYGELTLRQNGNRVEGQYPQRRGRITGTVQGQALRGTWSEPQLGAGDVEFTMLDTDHFRGCWRLNSNTPMRCDWNGTRR